MNQRPRALSSGGPRRAIARGTGTGLRVRVADDHAAVAALRAARRVRGPDPRGNGPDLAERRALRPAGPGRLDPADGAVRRGVLRDGRLDRADAGAAGGA